MSKKSSSVTLTETERRVVLLTIMLAHWSVTNLIIFLATAIFHASTLRERFQAGLVVFVWGACLGLLLAISKEIPISKQAQVPALERILLACAGQVPALLIMNDALA